MYSSLNTKAEWGSSLPNLSGLAKLLINGQQKRTKINLKKYQLISNNGWLELYAQFNRKETVKEPNNVLGCK